MNKIKFFNIDHINKRKIILYLEYESKSLKLAYLFNKL